MRTKRLPNRSYGRLESILQGDAAARQRYLEEMSLINALEEYSVSVGVHALPDRIRETNHIWIIYKMAAAMWLVIAAVVVFSNIVKSGALTSRDCNSLCCPQRFTSS